MRKILLILVSFCVANFAAAEEIWEIQKDGSIVWNVEEGEEHSDHIEMSGEMHSCVLRYGVRSNGSFAVNNRTIVWPMLRKIPNNTRGGLIERFGPNFTSGVQANGKHIVHNERVKFLKLDGMLTVVSEFRLEKSDAKPALELTREFYPSPTKPVFCERYTFKNISNKPITLSVPAFRFEKRTEAKNGVDGNVYIMEENLDSSAVGEHRLKPGETFTYGANIQAYKEGEKPILPDYAAEKKARRAFVDEVWSKLVFESPDVALNRMFAFAKIRGAESIYKTAGGYMHGPGGENYYAAIWANDQAEYINPFFPFLGYALGNESAVNSFRHWLRYVNPEYKHIPASIIAEGKDHWSVAGDRGDAAMIAYGAARYALARADKKEAEEIWPLIEWCLEYNKRKIIAGGVVASRSDELEGRFPSGKANLATSSLYYDALISAAHLAKILGKPKDVTQTYLAQAADMRAAIENYFGGEVEGFKTYKYYEGNTQLRSWICLPLTMGIYDRGAGTVAAMFSDKLWTPNGLLSQSGDKTFWDRSTLYGLRGALASGAVEETLPKLQHYSKTRLLGAHVPYAVEAFPEGGQRHLSAESGLYCRVITEGIFGIRPTGFNSFEMIPQLPKDWKNMALRNIHAFSGEPFDIEVERKGKNISTKILRNGKILKQFNSKPNAKIDVTFN